MQRYGDVAVTQNQYLYEIELNGKRTVTTGRNVVGGYFGVAVWRWSVPESMTAPEREMVSKYI